MVVEFLYDDKTSELSTSKRALAIGGIYSVVIDKVHCKSFCQVHVFIYTRAKYFCTHMKLCYRVSITCGFGSTNTLDNIESYACLTRGTHAGRLPYT